MTVNCTRSSYYSGLSLLVKKTNGIANGPNKAPIKAQIKVLAPLLSAIFQRRMAHDIVIMEMIIKPTTMNIPLY